MLSSIKKKQDCPLYIKICSLYANAIVKDRTFITWSQLEDYLDIIVERIKNSGKQFDAVVGIKTGGAIISDYISLKLGIPNYKIKLSRQEYNCDKQPKNALDDMMKKYFFYKQGEFTICEGINDNLENKNIILIDEIVATGKTMEESYNYLKEQKHVNEIYVSSVAFYKWKYNGSLKINNVLDGTVLIWPWGYDN
jgi:hypoxanthine phosphoribosyltransferase